MPGTAAGTVPLVSARRIPVVLDVDTGVDDACVLLLGALHPGLQLLAVTCVAGNAPLEDVVRNTLAVLDTAGRTDVPVAGGAARPLLEAPRAARHVHGEDGMGDLGWRSSSRRPAHGTRWSCFATSASPRRCRGPR